MQVPINAGPTSSSIPQQWDLKTILEELGKNSFLQKMDDLNEATEDVLVTIDISSYYNYDIPNAYACNQTYS